MTSVDRQAVFLQIGIELGHVGVRGVGRIEPGPEGARRLPQVHLAVVPQVIGLRRTRCGSPLRSACGSGHG